jgi:hypothetical protein
MASRNVGAGLSLVMPRFLTCMPCIFVRKSLRDSSYHSYFIIILKLYFNNNFKAFENSSLVDVCEAERKEFLSSSLYF